MVVNYVKLSSAAHEPTRGSIYAAGLDLYASEYAAIPSGKTVMVHTGIAVELPAETFGGIYARSGLATKQGLRPANCVGVIDADYRGEIIVALHNDSDEIRLVREGDRVAQLIVQPYIIPIMNEVDKLCETKRGDGGFGSTGTSSVSDVASTEYDCFEQLSMFDYINEKENADA